MHHTGRDRRGMARGQFSYRQFESSAHQEMSYEEAEAMRELRDRSVSTPAPLSQTRYTLGQPSLHARHGHQRPRLQNPDRLLSSTVWPNPGGRPTANQELQRSQIHLPPKLPSWIWVTITSCLGIGTRRDKVRLLLGTCLHVVTLLAALVFGTSGLFFNIYDTLSEFTKTSVLMGVAKSVLGLYWIGLGIYANSLASRLFSNPRMVDCIRLHSKTFMKVSAALIVGLLCLVVVGTNIYTNIYLLDATTPQNHTKVRDANCASIGVKEILCEVYFSSKVIYSLFCLTWNLLVVGIYLSVCRTHTVGIRRFMKELVYDTKIYEEFCLLQAMEDRQQLQHSGGDAPLGNSELEESWTIWDDDIAMFDSDSEAMDEPARPGPQLLKTLRYMRQNTRDSLSARSSSVRGDQLQNPRSASLSNMAAAQYSQAHRQRSVSAMTMEGQVLSDVLEVSAESYPTSEKEEKGGEEEEEGGRGGKADAASVPGAGVEECEGQGSSPARGISWQSSTLGGDRPPVMRNEDLMFTYFTLLRRLASTSRLLQRWVASWISFVLLWCVLYIVYWISHSAHLAGILQFLTPLLTLALLTSAYAEVNFEGERLLKCILPTEERLSVFFYFHKIRLELKIFSFTMTYNSIVTVIAGITITFATRIILDQVA